MVLLMNGSSIQQQWDVSGAVLPPQCSDMMTLCSWSTFYCTACVAWIWKWSLLCEMLLETALKGSRSFILQSPCCERSAWCNRSGTSVYLLKFSTVAQIVCTEVFYQRLDVACQTLRTGLVYVKNFLVCTQSKDSSPVLPYRVIPFSPDKIIKPSHFLGT